MEKNVLILGINGGFGALFSRLLFEDSRPAITGVDLSKDVHTSAKCSKYIEADLAVVDETLQSSIGSYDLIIICLPEGIAYKFLELYKHHISKTALVIDTLSVKNEVASIYIENDLHALSLNPMFGPDLNFEGKNIIVIKFKESPLSDWFITLLGIWKLNIVYTTSEEHDKISAIIQVATHAAIMAFGITLINSEIPVNELLKVATPPFLTLSALFGRITSGTKKVYWNIQTENEYASEARKVLIKDITALDKAIDDRKENDFNKLIEANSPGQKEIFKDLADYFSSLYREKTF